MVRQRTVELHLEVHEVHEDGRRDGCYAERSFQAEESREANASKCEKCMV